MIFARVRFVIALGLFVAWLGWLALAVARKDDAVVLSRARLAAATHLVVLKIEHDESGLPSQQAELTELIRGEAISLRFDDSAKLSVLNLPMALMPNGSTPQPSVNYLCPVVFDGKVFRLTAMPRSPGYEANDASRPVIYPWDNATRAQLATLKIMP